MHPLNLAVAFQVMSNIKNGQLRNCLAMGFKERDLEALSDPRCVGALVNSPAPWFTLLVDSDIVQRVLAHARGTEEEDLIRRALYLGASSPMLQQIFGLPPKEVAIRRTMLGIEYRKGRWRQVSFDEEMRLWGHWALISKEQGTNPQDPRSVLLAAMLMAEREPTLNLAMIWNQLQYWITEKLV